MNIKNKNKIFCYVMLLSHNITIQSVHNVTLESLNPQGFYISDEDITGGYRTMTNRPINSTVHEEIKKLNKNKPLVLADLTRYFLSLQETHNNLKVLTQPNNKNKINSHIKRPTTMAVCNNDIRAGYRVMTGQLITPEKFLYFKKLVQCHKMDIHSFAKQLLALETAQENLNIPNLSAVDIFSFTIHNGMHLYGFKTDLFISDYVAKSGKWEPKLELLMRKVIKKGDIVIDIGANIGYFTGISSELVGENGQVFSIEALPLIADLLKKAQEKNKWDNVNIINIALGDKKSNVNFLINTINPGHSRIITNEEAAYITEIRPNALTSVPMDTLDNLLIDFKLTQIDFIKIDVEGAEDIVLQGAQEILQRYHPKIALEFSPSLYRAKGIDPKTILTFLQNFGYKISIIREVADSINPIEKALTKPKDTEQLLQYIEKEGYDHLDLFFV